MPSLSPVDQFLYSLYPNEAESDEKQELQRGASLAMACDGEAGGVPSTMRVMTRAHRISLREAIRFGAPNLCLCVCALLFALS